MSTGLFHCALALQREVILTCRSLCLCQIPNGSWCCCSHVFPGQLLGRPLRACPHLADEHTWEAWPWAPCSIAWTCRLCLERDGLCLCNAQQWAGSLALAHCSWNVMVMGLCRDGSLCLNFFSYMSHMGSACGQPAVPVAAPWPCLEQEHCLL